MQRCVEMLRGETGLVHAATVWCSCVVSRVAAPVSSVKYADHKVWGLLCFSVYVPRLMWLRYCIKRQHP